MKPGKIKEISDEIEQTKRKLQSLENQLEKETDERTNKIRALNITLYYEDDSDEYSSLYPYSSLTHCSSKEIREGFFAVEDLIQAGVL